MSYKHVSVSSVLKESILVFTVNFGCGNLNGKIQYVGQH